MKRFHYSLKLFLGAFWGLLFLCSLILAFYPQKDYVFYFFLCLSLALFLGGLYFTILLSRDLQAIASALWAASRGSFEKGLRPHGFQEIKDLIKAMDSFFAFIVGLFSTLGLQNRILGEAREFIDSSSNEIKNHAQRTSDIAQDMKTSATQATEDIETIFTALQDLSTAATEIAQSISSTAQKTNEAQEHALATKETISRLSESSQKIGSIIKVINEIAEQTNLLALNATIEAARAGEAGKGFAVVANEVKELARQTAKATEEITRMVETIQQETQSAVSAVESITGTVVEVNDLANTIASAAEEQTVTISDITSNIERASNITREVKNKADVLFDHSENFEGLKKDLDIIETSVDNIVTEGSMVLSGIRINTNFMSEIQDYIPESQKIRAVLYQHQQWKDNVISAIIQGKPPEVETDPTKCGLGKFLKNYRPDPTIEPIIDRLKKVHHDLHTSVIDLQKMLTSSQERWQAITFFKERIQPIFNEILDLFNKWLISVDKQAGLRLGSDHLVENKKFMEWGPQFVVGVQIVDEQHQKLLNMVNSLYESLQSGRDKDYLKRLLYDLIDYTAYHFKTEEDLFDKYQYPESDIHKKIHEKLVKKVLDFKERVDSGEALISHDLMNFLKEWLVNHICITDKKFGSFLKEKGVS